MKKMTAILMLTTMLLCTACGNSDTGMGDSSVSSTVDNNSVSQAENDESSENNNSSAVDIEDSEPEDEGHYFDWRGVNYFVPAYFEDTYRSGKSIWGKELESGSKEYLCLEMHVSYGKNNGTDTYDVKDVPEILREYILSGMNEFFDVGATASEITVENEEQIQVLGVDFIKRTGIVHAVRSGKATGDLPYAAYYGLLDMSEYDKVPICWVTFSDDESTKDELESTADLFAEKLERVEK